MPLPPCSRGYNRPRKLLTAASPFSGRSLCMRYRWFAAVLLVALALGLTPAAAEVVEIDPEKDPVQTLDQAETQRLATLQHTAFPILASEISPDDTTVLHAVISPDG